MQYKFENVKVTEMPKNLVIVATNPLICYLIIKVDYVNFFLGNKLIVLSIEFKVFGETSFANERPVKPAKR